MKTNTLLPRFKEHGTTDNPWPVVEAGQNVVYWLGPGVRVQGGWGLTQVYGAHGRRYVGLCIRRWVFALRNPVRPRY